VVIIILRSTRQADALVMLLQADAVTDDDDDANDRVRDDAMRLRFLLLRWYVHVDVSRYI
jgi:hypothetical protein